MVLSPITSWQIDGETVETVADFIFWAPKSLHAFDLWLPYFSSMLTCYYIWKSYRLKHTLKNVHFLTPFPHILFWCPFLHLHIYLFAVYCGYHHFHKFFFIYTALFVIFLFSVDSYFFSIYRITFSISFSIGLVLLLLLLLSRFSRVQLCATPEMAAHQAPLSLGFSRQEHWSGLPFPSPMRESEKWKWSCSVVTDS